ncbi:MAG: amidohydrolase family protein, partial [Sphingomonadaceae bacterium]|nr:amidohydrolase family protein [Sphingomonadaceae bacterium]
MSDTFDMILRGGAVFTPGGLTDCDVGIRGGKIAALLSRGAGSAGESVDCTGLTVLPGAIDTQVHFREPGLEHKVDLESGSRAAVLGGSTGLFEMPNTKPNTDTADALNDKLARAKGRMWCDHAFYVGATNQNAETLGELEMLPGCSGIKIFMGASTG